MKTINITDTPE